MNFGQIKSVISDIISNHFSINTDMVTVDSNITNDFGADSLDAVEILMEIEDKTGVAIPDSDVLELKTIGDIVNYISRQFDESDVVSETART